MKTFKDFIGPITEIVGIAPKAKGEHKFVHTTYMAQTKDPGDLEKVGPEEVGPKGIQSGQGKRPADRLDNKQKFAEGHDDNEDHMEKEDEKDEEEKQRMMTGKKKSLKSFKESLGIDEADSHQAKTTMKHISNPNAAEKKAAKDIKPGIKGVKDRLDMLQAAKNRGALKDEVEAHTIIKSKMKEDVDSELLMKLYDDLSEENQNLFMVQLEEDADALLVFAQNLLGE